jgi:hypothetical protein
MFGPYLTVFRGVEENVWAKTGDAYKVRKGNTGKATPKATRTQKKTGGASQLFSTLEREAGRLENRNE